MAVAFLTSIIVGHLIEERKTSNEENAFGCIIESGVERGRIRHDAARLGAKLGWDRFRAAGLAKIGSVGRGEQ